MRAIFGNFFGGHRVVTVPGDARPMLVDVRNASTFLRIANESFHGTSLEEACRIPSDSPASFPAAYLNDVGHGG